MQRLQLPTKSALRIGALLGRPSIVKPELGINRRDLQAHPVCVCGLNLENPRGTL